MLHNNNELLSYSFELISYSFLEEGQVKPTAWEEHLWDFANTELCEYVFFFYLCLVYALSITACIWENMDLMLL